MSELHGYTHTHKHTKYPVETARKNPQWHFLSFIFPLFPAVIHLSFTNSLLLLPLLFFWSFSWHFVEARPTISQRENLVHQIIVKDSIIKNNKWKKSLTDWNGRWKGIWRRGCLESQRRSVKFVCGSICSTQPRDCVFVYVWERKIGTQLMCNCFHTRLDWWLTLWPTVRASKSCECRQAAAQFELQSAIINILK